jgi:SET domain-containing protein
MASLKRSGLDSTKSRKNILGKEGVAVKTSTFLENELGVIAIRNFKPGDLVFTIMGPIVFQRTKYSFQFGPNEHIEPINEKDGSPGLGHFLNHSCNPNVGICVIRRGENGYIQVVARKNIKKK